jgi:hypothetical protein
MRSSRFTTKNSSLPASGARCAFRGSPRRRPQYRYRTGGGKRSLKPSRAARTWACSSIRRIWCGSSWIGGGGARIRGKDRVVHLKDAEILWHVPKRGGIQAVDFGRWRRFRVPGYGPVDWEIGYAGAMNIESLDAFYYPGLWRQSSLKVQPRLPRGARIPQDARGAGGCLAAADSAVPGRPSGVLITVFGGCGQDNVVGLSRTQFLADVGFKLGECEVCLRRKIFSVPESRRQVVVTARPADPGATLEPRKKERSLQNGSAVRKRRPRGRPDA